MQFYPTRQRQQITKKGRRRRRARLRVLLPPVLPAQPHNGAPRKSTESSPRLFHVRRFRPGTRPVKNQHNHKSGNLLADFWLVAHVARRGNSSRYFACQTLPFVPEEENVGYISHVERRQLSNQHPTARYKRRGKKRRLGNCFKIQNFHFSSPSLLGVSPLPSIFLPFQLPWIMRLPVGSRMRSYI